MIRAYVDVSGGKEHRVIAAAAYFATDAQWKRFEKSWSAILRDAKVDHFHATDFYSCRGAFKDWARNSPRQNQFSARFAGAAKKHTQYGFAFGVDLDHFDRELGAVHAKVNTPHRRMTPAMVCVARVLNRAARLVLSADAPPVAVYLEEGRGVGEVIDFLQALKRLGEPSLRPYISFETAPKSERPLQAADLIAHESWRRITEHLDPKGRDIRKPLKILLMDERVELHLATKNDFRRMASKLEMFLADHPDYAAAPAGPSATKTRVINL